MRPNLIPADSTCQAQSFDGAMVYLRAIGCARFAKVENALVCLMYENSWFRPRFVLGQTRPVPVELSASKLASVLGFARQNVQDAIRALRQGSIILEQSDGRWLLNSAWRDWMRGDGTVRILETCHAYIRRGFPVNHACGQPDMIPPDYQSDQHSSDSLPHTTAATTSGENVRAQKQGLSLKGDKQLSDLSPSGDTVSPNQDSRGDRLTQSDASESDRATHPKGDALSPSGDSPRVRANTERASAHAPAVDRSYSYSEDFCLNGDISHTGGNESDGKNPSDTGAPRAREAHTRRGSARIYFPSMPDPQGAMTIEESIDAMQGCNREEIETPEDAARRALREVDRFGGAYPGDITPDPAVIAQATALAERHLPSDTILQGIRDYRFVFPSWWILKAVKRVIVKKVPIRDFRYIHTCLKNWKLGAGPDVGPEDDFDAALAPNPTPEGMLADPSAREADRQAYAAKFRELYPDDGSIYQAPDAAEFNAKYKAKFEELYPHLKVAQ